jgi:hypothetical protein
MHVSRTGNKHSVFSQTHIGGHILASVNHAWTIRQVSRGNKHSVLSSILYSQTHIGGHLLASVSHAWTKGKSPGEYELSIVVYPIQSNPYWRPSFSFC